MAYSVINEVHGWVGVGDYAEKLWQTEDPLYPYAPFRYWEGGSQVSPARQWSGWYDVGFHFDFRSVYFRTAMVR